jgi:hypothetical protein
LRGLNAICTRKSCGAFNRISQLGPLIASELLVSGPKIRWSYTNADDVKNMSFIANIQDRSGVLGSSCWSITMVGALIENSEPVRRGCTLVEPSVVICASPCRHLANVFPISRVHCASGSEPPYDCSRSFVECCAVSIGWPATCPSRRMATVPSQVRLA